jgi:hypothetical protein
MKLSECKHGIIVETSDIDGKTVKVGMIIGITNNADHEAAPVREDYKRAIPMVQWSCGATYAIHHANIRPYKDYY